MSDVHVEPILAYRAWGAHHFDVGDPSPLLSSTGQLGRFWPPQQVIPAYCWNAHKAPAEDCKTGETMGCGYYAMKAPPDGKSERPSNLVQGEVYLWGKVIEHEDGYRAEYAYPAAIYSDSPYAKELAALYGVPVKEPPYEPDRKALEDNPSGANYSAGTLTANTAGTWLTYTCPTCGAASHSNGPIRTCPACATALSSPKPYSTSAPLPAPAVAPRARKGARLNFNDWLTLGAVVLGVALLVAAILEK